MKTALRDPLRAALKIIICLFLFSGLFQISARAQHADTLRLPTDTPKAIWMNVDTTLPFRMKESKLKKLLLDAWQSIHQQPFSDTGSVIEKGWQQLTEAEAVYRPFEGKYIRHIEVLSLGFERNIEDTAKRKGNIISRAANVLHTDTRDWAVRQQLFFERGDAVLPFKLADNERYLRELRIFQDARILVQPAYGYPDSVDVLVITKDVFSLRGDLQDNRGLEAAKVRVGEINLFGTAQSLQLGMVADGKRHPSFGLEASYTNYSIGGSFINGEIYYSEMSRGPHEGREEERSAGIDLNRPLYSQYAVWTGGLAASHSVSKNYTRKPDSLFYNYSYQLFDNWLGYNIGARHLMHLDRGGSLRKVISARYLLRRFNELPRQLQAGDRPVYSDRQAVLLQLNLFRQTFFKTKYIYGFGVTEDLPLGFNVAFTAGWWQQLDRQRPYAGIDASYFTNASRGSFMQLFLRTGSFFNKSHPEDVGILAGADYFSPLYRVLDHATRLHTRISWSELIRPVIMDSLRLNNDFGLMEFNTDSASGLRRVSVMAEPQVYLNTRLFGFVIAPFLHLSGSFLWQRPGDWLKADFHAGLGGGVRARNENLVFNTVELRCVVFPRKVPGLRTFSVTLNTNVRFRYRSSFVQKPDIIQLNGDLYQDR